MQSRNERIDSPNSSSSLNGPCKCINKIIHILIQTSAWAQLWNLFLLHSRLFKHQPDKKWRKNWDKNFFKVFALQVTPTQSTVLAVLVSCMYFLQWCFNFSIKVFQKVEWRIWFTRICFSHNQTCQTYKENQIL
jgi:hypothetical protein